MRAGYSQAQRPMRPVPPSAGGSGSVRAFTVLRSGGDFTLHHAEAMDRMLAEHLPGVERVCLSDVEGAPNHVPLVHGWPRWWAKMELCRPDVTGPLLYVDLDTVILGDMGPLVSDLATSMVLRDFYRGRRHPHALGSGLMLLTEADRALVWDEWVRTNRRRWPRGDQEVFGRVLGGRVRYVQDACPGLVLGYKTDLGRGKALPPKNARVVCFHGKPRPWNSGQEWAVAPFRLAA